MKIIRECSKKHLMTPAKIDMWILFFPGCSFYTQNMPNLPVRSKMLSHRIGRTQRKISRPQRPTKARFTRLDLHPAGPASQTTSKHGNHIANNSCRTGIHFGSPAPPSKFTQKLDEFPAKLNFCVVKLPHLKTNKGISKQWEFPKMEVLYHSFGHVWWGSSMD